jgi:hypothetical protein
VFRASDSLRENALIRTWSLIVALFFVTLARGAEPAKQQWILVVAPACRAALEPLCQERKTQGFKVTIVPTTDVVSAGEIRAGKAHKLCERVIKICREFQGSSRVLIAGAVGKGEGDDPDSVVPALAGTTGRMRGEPTDSLYGDPDDNGTPRVAVGRFPARSAGEAAGMVRKTLELEHDRRPGIWRRRLTVLAGVPAFNPFVDRLVERLAMARLDRLDPSWTGRAIYHSPASDFCVPDAELYSRALRYVSEGQALTLYLGHSSPEGFWAGSARYLNRDDWRSLRIEHGPGVFATFGCNGCQLRGPNGEGYGVAAMRNPHGPVAVLGSHGICFAAMVQLASDAFVSNLLTNTPPERLETAWLALLRGLTTGKIDPLTFSVLDAVDGDSRIPLATQRREHAQMFVLLGDPALRLPRLPTDVKLDCSSRIRPGQELIVEGTLPNRLQGAKVHVTLERTPGSTAPDLEPLPATNPARDRIMLANHERANRFVLAAADVDARGVSFTAKLNVPDKVPGKKLILRAYAATEQDDGQGVMRLEADR